MHKDVIEKYYGKNQWSELKWEWKYSCSNRCSNNKAKAFSIKYQNKIYRLRAKTLIRKEDYYDIPKHIPDRWMWS